MQYKAQTERELRDGFNIFLQSILTLLEDFFGDHQTESPLQIS